MKIDFLKYHGTGNDFIMVDNMDSSVSLSNEDIRLLCHRHFGIGSDGIILLQPNEQTDFEMNFYNPDASQSFCGNGSRCAVHLAHELGLVNNECDFLAIDGIHKAKYSDGQVSVKMQDVDNVTIGDGYYFLNTGSPHHVIFVEDVDKVDVVDEGRKIRYSDMYAPGGTNVDFVMYTNEGVKVRIYERGVENETFSSGTGTTAIALATHLDKKLDLNGQCVIHTQGGDVKIDFRALDNGGFDQIWMTGPAKKVFEGTFEW